MKNLSLAMQQIRNQKWKQKKGMFSETLHIEFNY